MKVLITRPREDAAALAAELARSGIETAVEPLLEIHFADPGALDFDGVQAVLVTSRNGARGLAAATERRDVPVLAVGDATAAQLRDAGFDDVASAQGDAAALAALAAERLRPDAGPLLHAAGEVTAGNLQEFLEAKGFAFRRGVVYEARPAAALTEETVTLLRGDALDAVLFFSPRTAELFANLARQAGVETACGQLAAVCLSPAVADAAGGIAWDRIEIAERPDRAALLAGLGGLAPDRWEQPLPSSIIPETERPEDDAAAHTASDAPEHAAAETQSETQAAPPRAGIGIGTAIVVSVLVTIVVLAAAGYAGYATVPQWRDLSPFALKSDAGSQTDIAAQLADAKAAAAAAERDVTALKATLDGEVAALRQSLTELRERIAAAPAGSAAAPDLSAIESRIAALEQRKPAPPPDTAAVDALRQRVTALDSALSALDTRTQQGATQTEQQITTLSQKLSAADRMAGGDAKMAALVVATGRLQDALQRAAPYADALAGVKGIAPDDPDMTAALSALESRAATGVPTRYQLTDRFPAVARRIAQAAVAGNAGGWVDRTLARLSRVVTVRRVGDNAPAGSPDAAIDAAETALARGNLADAVTALSGLKGAPADAAAGWLADAKARLAADKAAAEIGRIALARLGGRGPVE